MTNANEKLGPAERIINTLLTYTDHVFHGRPGVVVDDPTSPVGKRWKFVTHKMEPVLEGGEAKHPVAYELRKIGKKTERVKLGEILPPGGTLALANAAGGEIRKLAANSRPVISDANNFLGEYREPGIFPEVAVWYWRQIAEIYKLDNEFVARWASYAFEIAAAGGAS